MVEEHGGAVEDEELDGVGRRRSRSESFRAGRPRREWGHPTIGSRFAGTALGMPCESFSLSREVGRSASRMSS